VRNTRIFRRGDSLSSSVRESSCPLTSPSLTKRPSCRLGPHRKQALSLPVVDMVPQFSAPRRRRAHPFLLSGPTAPIAIPHSHRRTVEQPLSPIHCNPALDDQLMFAMSPECSSPSFPARYMRARKDTNASRMSRAGAVKEWSASNAENKPADVTRPSAQQALTPAQKLAAEYRASPKPTAPRSRAFAPFSSVRNNPQLPSPASSSESSASVHLSTTEISAPAVVAEPAPSMSFDLAFAPAEKPRHRSASSGRQEHTYRTRPPPMLRWKTTPQAVRVMSTSGAGAKLSTDAVTASLVTPPASGWPSSVLLESELMDITLVADAPEKSVQDGHNDEPDTSLKRVQSDLQRYLLSIAASSKSDSPERGRRRERAAAR
jgi:hypothetical protein